MRSNIAALSAAALLAGCATAPTTSPADIPEVRPGTGILSGYLKPAQLPDSLALLPPPPAEGSAAMAADQAAFEASRAAPNVDRWGLAARDSELKFPQAASTFACALDLPIGETTTPHVNMLLRRTLADAGLSTYRAKDHYQRQRPFVKNRVGTCAPHDEASLSKDGSYPSGHSATGWAWALVLTQVAPDRADRLLARGHAFGQSRVVCGAHWQSDVEAGRVIGAAAFARLQSDPVFLAQLDAARAEVVKARAAGMSAPSAECSAEAAALKAGR